MRRLKISIESWPISGTFTISRGSRTEARVVVAAIENNGLTGRGECVPYARYGESVDSVAAQIDAVVIGGLEQVWVLVGDVGVDEFGAECADGDVVAVR